MSVKLWLGGALAALLASGAASAQDKIEIRFGTTNPPGGMQYLSGDEWVKRVNEKVGDLVQADIYGSSQLGDDTEMLQKVRAGHARGQPAVDHHVDRAAGVRPLRHALSGQGPGAYGLHRQGDRLADSSPRSSRRRATSSSACGRTASARSPTTCARSTSPEDLKGIKLRTPSGVWRVKMFQAYGANPTPMEFSEVFVALQTGVIDGQENPYANIYAAKFNEVQKYLSETNHVYTPSFPTASKRLFDSWPEEVQNAVLEAGAEVQGWTYDTAAKLDTDLKQKLIDGGMEFNQADREAFVAASKPVYDQFAAEVDGGQELIDKALALADGC